jgi:hypothetical protein
MLVAEVWTPFVYVRPKPKNMADKINGGFTKDKM